MTDDDPDGSPADASTREIGLVDEVYDKLRAIARNALARLPGRLDPTDLVHQAWMGLSEKWRGLPRAEFFALCATVMRRIVELRYFGGLTGDEVADVLGLSRKTVVRDWALARAWLKKRLSE